MTKKTIEIKINKSLINGILILVVAGLIIYNQSMIVQIYSTIGTANSIVKTKISSGKNGKDITNVDLSQIKSTGYAIAALFPVENIKTTQDAADVIIPTGTPDYGPQLGVSYDDPVNGLSLLANLNQQIQLSGSDQERYVSIVTKPVGISCEFCCGVGAVGATADGRSMCGCQHNPALLGLTKWLIQNTNYTDAEIVREALRWKALFFPKDMVKLTTTVTGGDTSALGELPGMVGGC